MRPSVVFRRRSSEHLLVVPSDVPRNFDGRGISIGTSGSFRVTDVAHGAAAARESMAEVAAVAEHSSASTQQVSATTHEASASVHVIATTTATLEQQAAQLAEVVAGFRVVE